MRRVHLALGTLALCAAAVVVAVLATGDTGEKAAPPPARTVPRATVERDLERRLGEPGPEQILPDGRPPRSVACSRSASGWSCVARYPGGERVRCIVGDPVRGQLPQAPVCT